MILNYQSVHAGTRNHRVLIRHHHRLIAYASFIIYSLYMKRAFFKNCPKILIALIAVSTVWVSGCAKKSNHGTSGGGTVTSDSPPPATPPADDLQALIAEFADDVIGVDPPTADGVAQMLEEQEIILQAKNDDI